MIDIQIKLGQCYIARFNKKDLPIRLERINSSGGWIARVLTHGRMIQVKDESQLIYLLNADEIREILSGKIPPRRASERNIIFCNEKELSNPDGDSDTNSITNSNQNIVRKIYRVLSPTAQESIVVTRMNILEAARRVLQESNTEMTTREIISAAYEKRYWVSRAATPWATLHAALSRDIKLQGEKSYFKKSKRGKFSLR
jgi:hypothetical protein